MSRSRMNIRIQQALETDMIQVAQIEKENFTDPWTLQGFYDAYQRNEVIFLTAMQEDEVAGYVLLYCAGDEGEIPTISVKNRYRRQGIASALLENLFQEAVSRKVCNIFLEVREGNDAAQLLYKKHGFEQVGMRKNFYQHPIENALVMKAQILN